MESRRYCGSLMTRTIAARGLQAFVGLVAAEVIAEVVGFADAEEIPLEVAAGGIDSADGGAAVGINATGRIMLGAAGFVAGAAGLGAAAEVYGEADAGVIPALAAAEEVDFTDCLAAGGVIAAGGGVDRAAGALAGSAAGLGIAGTVCLCRGGPVT